MLQYAVTDFSLLLSRGYATPSAIKLVGDRYSLTERQRSAVVRAACSDLALAGRKQRELALSAIANQPLLIDGYNILTTLETALSGGVILSCRDGCFRDMAGIHGTYRKVEETIPALNLLADFINSQSAGPIALLLDSPVSNSGRLKALIQDVNQNWKIDLVPDPDPLLSASDQIIISADSVILDACARWANLARAIISARIPDAWIADMAPP